MYYLFSLIGSLFVLFEMGLAKSKDFFRFNTLDAMFLGAIFFLIGLSLLLRFEPMGMILLLLFLSMIIYFKLIMLSMRRLLRIINITYLLYLILSIISYSGISLAQGGTLVNSFFVDYGFVSFETLYGLEGSTASIDSYSTLVLLLNIFLNRGLMKYIIIFITLIVVLWTARLTPIVMFLFSMVSFIFVRNRFIAIFLLTSIFIAFIAFTFIELYYPYDDFFIKGIPNTILLHIATHGRTFIWAEQFKSISDNFGIVDYLIGNYKYAEVLVHWSDFPYFNSHNSFFHLFFRIGIAAIFMIIFFISKVFYNFDRRTFPVIFGIFLSATTNGTIFYVGNPVFLLVLIYLTYFYKDYNIIK
tara:strand:- start:125 stop:1198 length:1074 start_codon:yes stop_codon:yes gene_type:complete